MNPGPGSYTPKGELNGDGQYFASKLRSNGQRTFYHHDRDTMSGNRIKTPGPGEYRLPSDFGFYESKLANSKSQMSLGSP